MSLTGCSGESFHFPVCQFPSCAPAPTAFTRVGPTLAHANNSQISPATPIITSIPIAYQGESGAYSEQAIHTLIGLSDSYRVISLPCPSFQAVFQALENGSAQYAMIPIENSLGGSIHENFDHLLNYECKILMELDYAISHCLMALPGTSLSSLHAVHSHPQALAQCALFISHLNVAAVAAADTAGSARMIDEQQLIGVGAIASELAAKTYGLNILQRNIEDVPRGNFTRFLLIQHKSHIMQHFTMSYPFYKQECITLLVNPKLSKLPQMKTSIVFTLKDQPGTLFKALSVFALRDIHLCKIESRPIKHLHFFNAQHSKQGNTQIQTYYQHSDIGTQETTSFQYLFFADIFHDAQHEHTKNAIRHLKEYAEFCEVIGTYDVYTSSHASGDVASSSLISISSATVNLLHIGIVGFGPFGRFLAQMFLKQGYQVYATSRSDYSQLAAKMGVMWCQNELELVQTPKLHVIIFSVSILSFEATIEKFPFKTLYANNPNCLLVDVLSVKQHPKEVFLKHTQHVEVQPDVFHAFDVLCTHPMWGPQSAKVHCKGLNFMFDRVHVRNTSTTHEFLDFFSRLGCRMLEMSCELHDQYAASSQFITHTTGRVLAKLHPVSTPINTKSYSSLLQIIDHTSADSWELYVGLFMYNKESQKQMELLSQALQELRQQLKEGVRQRQLLKPTPTSIFNPAALRMNPSKTGEVADLTKKLESEGREIISLNVGEILAMPTPPSIVQAAHQAMLQGHTIYTPTNGVLALRTAICEKLKTHNNLSYRPDQIVVSNGAKQSIYQALFALSTPDCEVLIPAPYWVSYPDMCTMTGAKPVFIHTTAEQGYVLTPQLLEQAITPNTKVLILCSPNNPTGAVYTKPQLQALVDVLIKHPQVFVISDEIYESLIYSPTLEHVSIASFPSMYARTIVVNGFSKSYVMTGFRVGYLAASTEIAAMCTKIQGQITSCSSSVSQYAAIEALKLPQSFFQEMRTLLNSTRVCVIASLRQIDGLKFYESLGAFYVLVDVSAYFGSRHEETRQLIHNSTDVCTYLLNSYSIAVVPGSAFGADKCIRIAYASAQHTVEKGMQAVKQAFSKLVRK